LKFGIAVPTPAEMPLEILICSVHFEIKIGIGNLFFADLKNLFLKALERAAVLALFAFQYIDLTITFQFQVIR
tara:strand:+ start:441 stop:659 length:219 start_codon:yes stop_codon:yes gene_type:complete